MPTNIDYPLAPGDKGLETAAASPRVSPALTLIAGWLVPGAGHLLTRRWIRGGLLFAARDLFTHHRIRSPSIKCSGT